MDDFNEKLSFAPFFKTIANGEDVRAIIEILARRLGTGVAFREAYTGAVNIVSSSEVFVESAKTFPMLELSRIYYSYNAQIGDIHSGILIFDIPADSVNSLSQEDGVFIENAIIAITLSLERSLSRALPGNEGNEEFFKELLSGDVLDYKRTEESFAQWGWRNDQEFMVLILHPTITSNEEDSFSARERHIFYSLARSKLLPFFPKSLCIFYKEMPVFLLPFNSRETEALSNVKMALKNILASLKNELPPTKERALFFAAGGAKRGLTSISQSFDEALKVISVSKSLQNRWAVIFWDLLGVHQLLAKLSKTEEARLFCTRILGKLIEEQGNTSIELLETLLALERCNWNIRAASKSLRFHYNTVKYRLDVLRNRINFEYADPEQRFNMGLALRLAPLFFEDKFITIYQKHPV